MRGPKMLPSRQMSGWSVAPFVLSVSAWILAACVHSAVLTPATDHINLFMHPQAVIIDGDDQEEPLFQRSARAQTKATSNTLIELPQHSTTRLAWITKLDTSALRSWNNNYVDILIQATPGSSGGLIRLLRSLSKADYISSSIPHLTIELPPTIDPPTKNFLESFKWPPAHIFNPTNARYLSLRHRIPHQRLNEAQSSTRFLESFWPPNPQKHHVLVLSPQVEVSPQFFHCKIQLLWPENWLMI